jgi:hypothetical protein
MIVHFTLYYIYGVALGWTKVNNAVSLTSLLLFAAQPLASGEGGGGDESAQLPGVPAWSHR